MKKEIIAVVIIGIIFISFIVTICIMTYDIAISQENTCKKSGFETNKEIIYQDGNVYLKCCKYVFNEYGEDIRQECKIVLHGKQRWYQ